MGQEAPDESCDVFRSETESPTETSIFLPVSLSENLEDENNFSRGTETVNNEDVRRISRNLSLLVITEGIPLDPEKVAESIAMIPNKTTENRSGDTRISRSNSKRNVLDKEKGCSEGDAEIENGKGGRCSNYAGILLTLASGFVYTLGGVIIKYMEGYHPFTLAVFRFQGILLPSLVMVMYAYHVQKIPIFEPIWPPTDKDKRKKIFGLMIRCIFGTTALYLHFYALKYLDVADALVIGSCQPVFVTLAAYFLLGEACGIFSVFTALLTIIGVGILSRPPILTGEESFDDNSLVGAGFSMAAMLVATLVFVVIRYLKDVHVSLLTLILGCWGTIQSIICSVVIGEFKLPESAEHWGLAVTLALVTLLGQVGLTLALQCEQAGPVALVKTCDCLFAFVLQFILLNTVPDLYNLTGASLIIFCVVLTAFRKWISTLPKNHPAKRKFGFVMR